MSRSVRSLLRHALCSQIAVGRVDGLTIAANLSVATGEHALPAGITQQLLDKSKAIETLRHETRVLEWDGECLEQSPYVTRRISRDGLLCDLAAHALSPELADEVVAGECKLAKARGMSIEWKAYSFDSPGDLCDRLRSAGFSIGPKEAVVVYDLSEGLGMQDLGVDVRRVDRAELLDDFQRASEAAFGRDQSRTVKALASSLGGTSHQGYIAYEGEKPCSAGRLFLNPASAFGGLYGGGTVPECRGRGYYRAIVAARASEARAAGAHNLIVDALPTSLPILLKLGFVHVADTWPCTLDFEALPKP